MEQILAPVPAYAAKVYRYSSGAVEVCASRMPEFLRPVPGARPRIVLGTPLRLPREKTPQVVEDNRRRAASRARSMVRRLCLTMGADRMLSTTFRENVTDQREAWRVFKRFLKLLRVYYPEFAYVAVAERQERGAWHFHVAIRGFYPVRRVRRLWLACAGKLGGNIDITRPKMHLTAAERSCSVARYLAKYMGKGFDAVTMGRHRYRAAENLEVVPHRFWLDATSYRACVGETLTLLEASGVPMRGCYFASDWSCVWCIGWP